MQLDEKRFKQVFLATLGLSQSELTSSLKLGDSEKWDSLSHLELLCAMEDEFNIQFTSAEFETLFSIDSLRTAIRTKLADVVQI